MKLTIALILGLLPVGLRGAEGLKPAEVRDFSLDCWKTLRDPQYAKPDAFTDSDHLASASLAAAADIRVAQWTGDKAAMASAADRLKIIARQGLKTYEANFFTSFPFSWSYAQVEKAGLVDADLKDLAARYVTEKFRPRDENLLFNQTLIRACGLAMAAKTWPTSPMVPTWRKYANTVFDAFLKLEDVPENSTNYNAIDVECPFLLADVLGRTEELRRPGIEKYYKRFVAQVSPAGFIPAYGDAGATPAKADPKWPIQNPWGFYVAAFERAGAFWKDPEFRWAAQRMFALGRRH